MKTNLIQKNPATVETELLVVFAINKAEKKSVKAEPVLRAAALQYRDKEGREHRTRGR